MSIETVPMTERPSRPDVAPPSTSTGLLYHWGPQAWIDMVMSKRMLVDRGGPMVPYTFLPILRISGDPEQIDRDWAEIKSRREEVRLIDSPRERWRKRYGNFVREIEWALLELRKHFTQEQYESIVVGTSVALAHENSTDFLEMMNSMTEQSAKAKPSADGSSEPAPVAEHGLRDVQSGRVPDRSGPDHRVRPGAGESRCTSPTARGTSAGAQRACPTPTSSPEEGCLLICKGAFEELFDGEDSGLRIQFEPHLPETSCTARMSWKPQA